MFLHISDTMTVEEVQDRFRECFPLLEIVFYREPLKKETYLNKEEEVASGERIAYIRDNHYNGALEIKSWYAVARVKQELKELFGLYAHIFRKDTEDGWMATLLRDNCTLSHQSQRHSVTA